MKWLLAVTLAVLLAVAAVWWQTRGTPPAVPRGERSLPAVAAAPLPSAPAATDARAAGERVPSASAVRPAPAEGQGAGGEEEAGDGVPVFEVESQEAFYDMLAELGLEDAQRRQAAWSRAHGYFQIDPVTGRIVRDQPYDQYDDDMLQALSADGDMWATQELAGRYARERPAEAIEMYRRAAAQGSLFALDELARLHRMAASENAMRGMRTEEARTQMQALREGAEDPRTTSYAWLVAAEMASGDPSRTASRARQLSADLTPEQIERACSLAPTLLDDIDSLRAESAVTQVPDDSPPPYVIAPGALSDTTECYEPERHRQRMAGCREARFTSGPMTNTVWVCDHD